MSCFEELEVVGDGAFGVVTKCRDKETCEPFEEKETCEKNAIFI